MNSPFNDSILRSLRRISRAIDQFSRQLANECNLTGPQLMCMRYLEKRDHVTPGELAKEVSLSQATVTGILDRLEKKGMVERQRSLLDKRKVIIELTFQGKAQLENSPQPLHYRFSSRLAMLPIESQKNISAVLEQIVEMMEAAEFDAAPILASGPANATSTDTAQFLTPENSFKENN